ncbi:MAG: hypothetical protein Ta2D_07240 [Rickettsiales bacterium]|nr:MAG: hypothetical protein Ta2D_07240 [Rickettsiales bacterium]
MNILSIPIYLILAIIIPIIYDIFFLKKIRHSITFFLLLVYLYLIDLYIRGQKEIYPHVMVLGVPAVLCFCLYSFIIFLKILFFKRYYIKNLFCKIIAFIRLLKFLLLKYINKEGVKNANKQNIKNNIK